MKILRVLVLAWAALAATSAAARIDLTVDADSLNGLLASMAPQQVDVPLAGRTLALHLQDLKVTGFDPAAGPNGGVTTSVRLVIPDLNLDVPVTPHLTLDTARAADGQTISVLRFDKVMVPLPVMGPIDLASLLPPLPLVPDTTWVVDSARGPVRVRPKLIDAKTGAKNIRLGFDLAFEPATAK